MEVLKEKVKNLRNELKENSKYTFDPEIKEMLGDINPNLTKNDKLLASKSIFN